MQLCGAWLDQLLSQTKAQAAREAYVATGEPLQCASGFALEGRGGALVERIEGCFWNVIGLSLPLLRRWLTEA
jgi:septum formation protein